MITKELERKIIEAQDVEAVVLMTRLASYCAATSHCCTCPFYNRDNYKDYNCQLTRTLDFSPADWEIKSLVD